MPGGLAVSEYWELAKEIVVRLLMTMAEIVGNGRSPTTPEAAKYKSGFRQAGHRAPHHFKDKF